MMTNISLINKTCFQRKEKRDWMHKCLYRSKCLSSIWMNFWIYTCNACALKENSTWTSAVEWTLSVFCCHLSSRVSKSSNHGPVGSRSPWLHSSVKPIIVGPPLLHDLSLFLLSFCFLHTATRAAKQITCYAWFMYERIFIKPVKVKPH